jgi:hypothetical protein
MGVTALDALLPSPVKTLPVDHLSASALGQFSRCPEQFRRVRVLKQRQRPASALIWGNADGDAFDHNFGQKIESHEDLPAGELEEKFAACLDERVEQDGGAGEVDWSRDCPGKTGKQAVADVKDRGTRLVRVYRELVAPSVQPIAVQRKFTLDLPGVPVPIIGYIDAETEPLTLEFKTAGKADTVASHNWRLQGQLYQAVTGKPLRWHVKNKKATTDKFVVTGDEHEGLRLAFSARAVEATEDRVRRLVAQLAWLWQTYGPDEPWPTHAPDVLGWGNPCTFCGFRSSCAWWQGS